jgi:hypothetical protein
MGFQEETMCPKARFVFHPRVEDLESRLQPGSMITSPGYGWSLLVDQLGILPQGALDSPSLASPTPSAGGKQTQINTPATVPAANLDIAIASVAAGQSTSRRSDHNLPTGFVNTDLFNPTPAGQTQPAVLAPLPIAPKPLSPPATPVGSVPQSPIGVAMPGVPAQSSGKSANFLPVTMMPLPGFFHVDVQALAGGSLQPGPHLQVQLSTQTSAGGLINTHMAVPTWASFLGSAGDDRLLSIALDPNVNDSQALVVVGFSQSVTDPTEYDGLIARVSTDGSAATIVRIAPDAASDTRTEFHSVVVDSSGAIYVSGQTTQAGVTTDVIARVNATLTNVDWQYSHQPAMAAHGNSVQLDNTGTNLYATGDIDGNTYVTELTDLAGPQSIVYDRVLNFPLGPSTGNGIAPDSAGNADLAIQVQATPDAIPVVLQLNALNQPNSSGSVINWNWGLVSTGRNGGLNAVSVDSQDNVNVTGGIGFTNPPLLDQAIASLTSSGVLLNGVGFGVTGGGNMSGYGIQNDAAGNIFATATGANAGDLLGEIFFWELNLSGIPTLLNFSRIPYGSLDDQSRGLALDPVNKAAYVAGFTNSPDFGQIPLTPNFMANAFQPAYGGDPYDGVVIGYHYS